MHSGKCCRCGEDPYRRILGEWLCGDCWETMMDEEPEDLHGWLRA